MLALLLVGVAGENIDIVEVGEKISELKRSKPSLALPSTWISGLTSISSMLRNLHAGIGPSDKGIRQLDPFRLHVVKR